MKKMGITLTFLYNSFFPGSACLLVLNLNPRNLWGFLDDSIILYSLTSLSNTSSVSMGTPEFPDLGKHCSVDYCKQIDFLPFTCDRCIQVPICFSYWFYDIVLIFEMLWLLKNLIINILKTLMLKIFLIFIYQYI